MDLRILNFLNFNLSLKNITVYDNKKFNCNLKNNNINIKCQNFVCY